MDGLERIWREHHNCEIETAAKTGLENAPVGEIKAWMEGMDEDMKKIEKTTKNKHAGHSRVLVAYDDVTRSHYA